jgi:hypothetical protein
LITDCYVVCRFRRFLRARKFDIDGAYNQFKDTEEWRKQNEIEALYRNIDVESYEEARAVVSFPVYPFPS